MYILNFINLATFNVLYFDIKEELRIQKKKEKPNPKTGLTDGLTDWLNK